MIESCIVIPSRWGSQRFTGKPLAKISGKTMIKRVLESALKSSAESVIVATDDERIYEECEGYSTMTGDCPNGTSRVIEVAKRIASKVYVNLQGDEPLVSPSDLDLLIHKCQQMKGIHTLMTRIDEDEVTNTNVVKVFCDNENECWHFTRNASNAQYKHIGIYAFSREILLELENLKPTLNSVKESLEQITWLDNEYPIYAWVTNHKYQAVDTIEDVQKVIDILDEDSLHHSNL
jgi:3-deoxy-manno-octulosonate cytidylyltransferase (CMP-KDO synthetase)